ncbi:antiviral RADAR system adenosine deaminase RdrB [Pseudomonas urmiensis]|uniref:antiviral RADAR system adenosine deaminase RdrB n=1 Tax=Pseudomonas urmiensis TaxID=2745493 RepID=UPI0034D4D506
MLETQLLEQASTSLLSSAALANRLRSDLLGLTGTQRLGDFDDRIGAYRRLIKNTIDNRNHGRFRANDLERAAEHACPQDLFRSPLINSLDIVFKKLFICSGDYIHYRPDCIEDYSRLCSQLDPSVVVAWNMARWFTQATHLRATDVHRIVLAQQPLFSPPSVSNKPYSEGHVHLGGAHFEGIILMNQVAHQPGLETFAPLHRLCHALLGEWPTRLKNQAPAKILQLYQRTLGKAHMSNGPLIISWSSLSALQSSPSDHRHPSWLKLQLAEAINSGDLSKAWLWLLIWLWTQYQHAETPAVIRMGIFYLVLALMSERRKLLMDGQGLTRFSGVYSEFSKASKHDPRPHQLTYGRACARQMFQNPEDCAELKITQSIFTADNMAKWVSALEQHHGQRPIVPLKTVTAHQAKLFRTRMERWHLCIHFLRRPDHLRKRGMIWLDGEELYRRLRDHSGWAAPEFLNGKVSEHFRFEPSAWVRGLDVAGDENKTRNELYAPMLRWLRAGLQPANPGDAFQGGLHLSIHTGEDYAHPLSGMRHIDETVRFCEMRHGDRIGHALAVGVSPSRWCENQGDMLVPVDEHLDNLVWLWHHATQLATRVPLANQILPRLERRIAQFVPHVAWTNPEYLHAFYPVSTSKKTNALHKGNESRRFINPHTLYEAWRLRRNCFHMLEKYRPNEPLDDKMSAALPDLMSLRAVDFVKLNGTHQDPDAALLYWRRSTLLSHASYTPRMVHIRVNRHSYIDEANGTTANDLLLDYETSQELDFMEALQDHLIETCDQRGIIFETNPSSNVYIARIGKHAEHPIFRWSPPDESALEPGAIHNRFGLRRGPIRVTINTDDPGVIPTTLRTEYALLQEAARSLGISRTRAEEWLERLRIYANDQFQRNHRPVFQDR